MVSERSQTPPATTTDLNSESESPDSEQLPVSPPISGETEAPTQRDIVPLALRCLRPHNEPGLME